MCIAKTGDSFNDLEGKTGYTISTELIREREKLRERYRRVTSQKHRPGEEKGRCG